MQPLTLKKNREFRTVYAHGKSSATKSMAMVWLRRKYGGIRPGFSVSKKIGCSVRRNRVRRQLKECFRELSPLMREELSIHVIFIARQPITNTPYADMLLQMRSLLKKAEVIKERR